MTVTSCFRVKDALDLYLARIGFKGEPMPNLATLRELHRLHVQSVTFENLDVRLGLPVSRNPRAAFRKIVGRRRGGWCYESNGLFAFMLEAIGFRVQRLAGGVMREKMGDAALGNHLTMIVKLDRLYLCDVSVGIGLVEPAPLVEGPFRQGFRQLALERVGGGFWRLHNHPGEMPPSFDFSAAVTDEALLEAGSQWLQQDAASPFVGHVLMQRQYDDRLESLVDRVHSVTDAAGRRSRDVTSLDEYARLVGGTFGLEVSAIAALWAKAGSAAEGDFLAAMQAA